MDLTRYEAFVAAVETSSMSGAAKQLGYTPSGIIRLINALEDELGFQVLARSSSGVTPTVEGMKLLPLFQEMTALSHRVDATSSRIRGLAEGNLTIGCLFSIASCWLPPVIKAYQQRFPGVTVNIIGGSDVQLVQMLERHEVDCCLCHGPQKNLEWIPIDRQELVAWMPADSPLARHSSIILAEFDGQPFIRIHSEGRTFAERLLETRNIEPDIRFTTGDCYTAYSLVGNGLGMTLCCNGISDEWNGMGKVAIRPLSPQQYFDFGIVAMPSTGNTPAVDAFIELAKTFRGTWPRANFAN